MNTSSASPRKKLPIGIQNLRELREEGHYYADKSGYAVDLAHSGKYYFLSRPRRFGKSLFLDTLKELFEGNAALFKGLAAENRWDWSKNHPVIRLSFGGGVLAERAALEDSLDGQFLKYEKSSGLVQSDLSLRRRLVNLIEHLHQQTGQRVVVLVDEYDKPILDCIDRPAIATEMREMLKDIYSVLKDADVYLKFVFLTGVSKFSKVSLFSGLNNLQDITMDARYSALCGYTDGDVDTVFAPELPGLDREQIRLWYNGYNWLGESVYNPFDVLLLFSHRKFKPYWFETGTPTFLIKLLADRQFFTPNLSHMVAHEKLLSTFDVDNIPPEALLFQTGYLTIHDSREPLLGNWVYTLGYPNREVESSLNMALLTGYGLSEQHALNTRLALIELLQTRNLAAMEPLFHALFAGIPHDWYRKNPLAQFEGYYASIFYSYFAALGLDIRLEDATNHGRIDMAVLFNGEVLLFEFKVVELTPTGRALQQIKDKGYADKYRARGEPIHLIGVEFSKDSRNVVGFEVETG
jgi:hypothetical protein